MTKGPALILDNSDEEIMTNKLIVKIANPLELPTGIPPQGYPDNNPKTQFGLQKIPMDLCPPALTRGAAEAFANGAAKYGAYNWREKMISSSVYYAACKRHLDDWWDRVDEGDLAPDSLVHHLKHAVACIGMILDTMGSPLLNDNRPRKVERKS